MGVLLHLLSGVALLVWGTNIVKVGILRVYGANLRHVLSVSVSNRFTAFAAGLGVASVPFLGMTVLLATAVPALSENIGAAFTSALTHFN